MISSTLFTGDFPTEPGWYVARWAEWYAERVPPRREVGDLCICVERDGHDLFANTGDGLGYTLDCFIWGPSLASLLAAAARSSELEMDVATARNERDDARRRLVRAEIVAKRYVINDRSNRVIASNWWGDAAADALYPSPSTEESGDAG